MRYFMDSQNEKGELVFADDEGAEFDVLDDAIAEAKLAAGQMIANRLRAGEPVVHRQFRLRDEGGRVHATFGLEELLTGRK